jgi:hypothetical protein
MECAEGAPKTTIDPRPSMPSRTPSSATRSRPASYTPLKQHYSGKPLLSDVKDMFEQMKDSRA